MVRYAALLVLVLAGCASPANSPSDSPSGTPPATSSSQAVTGIAITVEKTGGIAGVRDTVQIDATGKWARSDKMGKSTSGQLTAAQVTELQTLATDPKLAAEVVAAAQAAPTKCNDTFVYTISAGPVAIRFNDCPSDSFQPVAAKAIVSYVDKATVG